MRLHRVLFFFFVKSTAFEYACRFHHRSLTIYCLNSEANVSPLTEVTKRRRGRPRKAVDDRRPAQKKTTIRKRLTRAEQDEAEMNRSILATTLVIVSSNLVELGKQEDTEIIRSIKNRCLNMFGDRISVQHSFLEAEEKDNHDEFYREENAPLRQTPRGLFEYDTELVCKCVYISYQRNFSNITLNLPKINVLILKLEMWLESAAGVCRLLSRRSKKPLVLTTQLEEDVMVTIADLMREERHFEIDVFRDETNFPELT